MRALLTLLLAAPAGAVGRGTAARQVPAAGGLPVSGAAGDALAIQVPFPDGEPVFPSPFTVWWTPATVAAQAPSAPAAEPTPAAQAPAAPTAAESPNFVDLSAMPDAGEALERLYKREKLSSGDVRALEAAAIDARGRRDTLTLGRLAMLATHDPRLKGVFEDQLRGMRGMTLEHDASDALRTIDRASRSLEEGARSFMLGELRKVFDGSK